LVTSEGSTWLRQRAKISPVFKNEILSIIPDIAKRSVMWWWWWWWWWWWQVLEWFSFYDDDDDDHDHHCRAVERMAAKLETYRGSGKPIEIGEEFRHLTLQVSWLVIKGW